jgi:hypothetical protein
MLKAHWLLIVGLAAAGLSMPQNADATPAPFAGGVYVAAGDVNGDGIDEIVTGPGAGGGPHVRLFHASGAPLGSGFMAYDPAFTGGVRVAACDVDGDGRDEIVTSPGAGGGPHIRVLRLDVSGNPVAELAGFYAYHPAFTGGVFVACGDVDGDGIPEIITGADAGGGPHVRILRIQGGTVTALFEFFAYHPAFTGGVRVAAGNLDGSDRASVITAAGPGGGPHVRAIKLFTSGGTVVGIAELASFFAYAPTFTGGVFVASGNVTGDGRSEIITGADTGGGPHVRVLAGTGADTGIGFYAYHPDFTGGVRVASGNLAAAGPDEIVTAPGPSGDPHVSVWTHTVSATPYSGRDATGQEGTALIVVMTVVYSGSSDASGSGTLVDSPPIVIDGRSGVTIRGLRIRSSSGQCVTIRNSSNVVIEDSEIGPCAGNGIAVTDSHDVTIASSRISTQRSGRAGRDSGLGIYILTSSNVVVRGSHLVANESGVYAVRSRAIRVLGNYFVGPLGPYPRGEHAQLAYVSGGEVTGNYGVAAATDLPIGMEADQEDAINIYRSTGISVARNYLVGGNSPSGCGIIVEGRESADNVVEENILVRTGNCGIGIGNGVRNTVRANKVLDTNIPSGAGNVGIYVAHLLSRAQRQARAHGESVQQEVTCSDNVVVGNVVSNQLPAGDSNDIYTPNTCARTVREGNLTGTAARVNLLPEADRLPPPPIPPLPHAP